MPKKNNSRHMRAKSIPGDASSSDEIRHVHVVGKIEGHGSIIKGGPFIPTPNFHIHRSGISICGTLYFINPEENLRDIETILKAFDNGTEPKFVINKWVDSMNARQIAYNLGAPTNENTSKEFYIKHFGRVQGEKINQNVMLGYEMAAQEVPGVLTEEYYGEKEPLADKSFGGRQPGDPPDVFVPETTEHGPALCIYGVFVKNKYHKVSKCITLPNGVKMSEMHQYIRLMRNIRETDIIHFHFLDTACNFHDLTLSSFPLVSNTNRNLIEQKYNEYYEKANKMDVEGVEEKPATPVKPVKHYKKSPEIKSSARKTKNIVSKSKRLKVSSFTRRRLARAKARAEASMPTPPTPTPPAQVPIVEDSSSSSESSIEAIAKDFAKLNIASANTSTSESPLVIPNKDKFSK